MRTIEYLSPTSISKFEENLEEFYLQYLAEDRPDKLPQTQPMSVGSAFDAYAKSFLHERLFGKGSNPRFEFDTLFTTQVEEQNRDFAIEAGKHCFDSYRVSGALSDLFMMMENAQGEPQFEFEVKGVVDRYRDGYKGKVGDVVFMGKPDAYFKNKDGHSVMLDWKVNGYCGNYNTSPKKGYVRVRDGWTATVAKPSRNANAQHKDAFVQKVNGVDINIAYRLETAMPDWARQLAIYSWLVGEPVGSDFICCIDQLVCKPTGDKPLIRVAEHRGQIGKEFQEALIDCAKQMWETVRSDHIFREMSLEDSQQRCKTLDKYASGLKGDTEDDEWFRNTTRMGDSYQGG